MHKTVKSRKLAYHILEHCKVNRFIWTSHILPVPPIILTKGLGKLIKITFSAHLLSLLFTYKLQSSYLVCLKNRDFTPYSGKGSH